MKDKISELLYNELDYIYCDNCKFCYMSEEESNEKYGYYDCEDCRRKCMGWEISKKFSDRLAEKIMNIIGKKANNMKPMYVIKFNNDEYWCGNNKFDKQIRKAQIFHSMKYIDDVCEKFKELEPKIIQIEINIIGEVK